MTPEQKPLPRKIAVRLADLRRHYQALRHILEETPHEGFVEASRSADPDRLSKQAYPLERSFEVLCNYVAELNELGLASAGLTAETRPANLRRLEQERVLPAARARRWRGILGARNELQHDYPDLRAARIYKAAVEVADDLPGYVRDYVAWMRRLGFGEV